MSYEPKIEVVLETSPDSWTPDTGRYVGAERAYLVRGLPMPGERVRHDSGRVGEVVGPGQLSGEWLSMHVRNEDGDARWALVNITPYDPEAERLRVATEAVRTHAGQRWVVTTTDAEVIARAVLGALKEVDDG